MLPHAPGVQMADIPEDSVDINKEKEGEDEGGEGRAGEWVRVRWEISSLFFFWESFQTKSYSWKESCSFLTICFIFRKVLKQECGKSRWDEWGRADGETDNGALWLVKTGICQQPLIGQDSQNSKVLYDDHWSTIGEV